MDSDRGDSVVLCPRCMVNPYFRYRVGGPARTVSDPPYPALSRVAQIHICSPCGQDEALRDFRQLPPIPPDEWPVAHAPTAL